MRSTFSIANCTLELVVVGQNLLNRQHPEFATPARRKEIPHGNPFKKHSQPSGLLPREQAPNPRVF
jgi:hypothetical protein